MRRTNAALIVSASLVFVSGLAINARAGSGINCPHTGTCAQAVNTNIKSGPGIPYTKGDVFAAIGNGQVDEFTPTGVLVQTLNDGSGASFTTGMAFDSAGNLYITNFSSGTVSKLDNSGNIVNSSFITGVAVTIPESVVAVGGGSSFYIGGPDIPAIDEFNSTGGFTQTFNVGSGGPRGGTDWIDFQNSNTIIYTSEGSEIRSFNISTNTQNPDITDTLPGSAAYALRAIPSGSTDAGDILVADSSNALLLSATGAILQTYTLPGNGGGDFSGIIRFTDPNHAKIESCVTGMI